MSSFAAPDYTLINPIRIFKFLLLFITGTFGLFGFVMGLTFITINILSLYSFGVAYSAPIAPINLRDLKNFFLSDINLDKMRPRFLRPKDKRRQ
ncbi:hypothetical protein L21TH_0077 [Caldisalinibacter kiritimatiensis]|uniref:Uncharacterized protein n=2 Tax=Caldisalinibacter kiritimatiensis TaxID=1304284 RepID=R1CHR1_9FIRM|nr:hypothetical protein L21TH_0077 [Caldisalinibacter kiritimatiensis]